MRSKVQEHEHALHDKGRSIFTKIKPYKPIEESRAEENTLDLTIKIIDKRKQKVMCIQINEPTVISKDTHGMFTINLELEKAKELEKVENEAQVAEMKRKI